MGGLYGADVAELRALAQQFDRDADRLEANRMTVGNAIQISAWVGPVAVRFRHQWDSDYSSKVHAASVQLRDAAGKLRANADDQERTSAVDHRASGGLGASGAGDTTGDSAGGGGWDDWNEPGMWLPWSDRILNLRLSDQPLWDSLDMSFFLSKVPGIGDVVDAVSLINLLSDPAKSDWDKFFGVTGSMVDSGAGWLRHSGTLPGYLTGVATAQVWDVIDNARQMDVSPDQLRTNFDFITSDPWGAATGAADAVVAYIPDLVDNFWPF